MLNKTSVTAIRALVYLGRSASPEPIPPIQIANALGASPAYLSKINAHLTRAGILQAHRGIKGGVTLARLPSEISLLHIVEACQGRILGDYCQPYDDTSAVCAFHAAMQELQHGILATLSRWTLADILEKPQPDVHLRAHVKCCMGPDPFISPTSK